MQLEGLIVFVLCGAVIASSLVLLAAIRGARPDAGVEALQEQSLNIEAPEVRPAQGVPGSAVAAGSGESTV